MIKIILILIFVISSSFCYEKGYIDTHGGKNNPLTNKKVDFTKNNNFLYKKIKIDNNSSKIKTIDINSIKNLNF